MQFDILTLFPKSFSYLSDSIIGKAQSRDLIKINVINLRDFSKNKHKAVDDRPFGGGAGMLLQIEPIYYALKSLGVYPKRNPDEKVVLTSAKGSIWTQKKAMYFQKNFNRLVIICGHYEGVDERVSKHLVDFEISIGKFILSGGEIPSMAIIDSISRMVKGVLGSEESLLEESFLKKDKKEYPQYTRPENFVTEEGENWKVPKVLLSGDHKKIQKWKSGF